MGCLLVLMSAFAPRLVFLIIWIARPAYVDAVFDTFILPRLDHDLVACCAGFAGSANGAAGVARRTWFDAL